MFDMLDEKETKLRVVMKCYLSSSCAEPKASPLVFCMLTHHMFDNDMECEKMCPLRPSRVFPKRGDLTAAI